MVLWLCLFACLFPGGFHAERGFRSTQICSCPVLENPNCTLLDMDNAACQLNAWQVSGNREGSSSRIYQDLKNTTWKVQSGFSGHFILFHWSSLHVITPLSSAAFWWTNNNTNKSIPQISCLAFFIYCHYQEHSLRAVLHFNKSQDFWARGDQSWGAWL